MIKSWKSILSTLAMVAVLAGQAGAKDPKGHPSPAELQKMMEEAGKPGAEHKKLESLVGSWTYVCRAWMDPSKPPVESKGTIERKWILGGRFIEEKITGTGFDGQPGFEGLGMIGYDKAQKRYTMTFVCNMGTGISTGTGSADSSSQFTFKTICACPLSKDPIKGRDVIRIESKDRVVTESYQTIEGKEVKGMEIITIRKK